MRLSIEPDDVGYCPHAFGSKVFFDGTEIRGAITADEERRMVKVHVLNEAGRVQLNKERTEVLTEWRYGHVRIELSPRMNRYLSGIEEGNEK